jgi:hypothetical protein
MALAPRLNSPAALLRKPEREAYRAFHAESPLQKSDHFYNFCVTASSTRDYCHEHSGHLTKAQRKPQEQVWWQNPLLVRNFRDRELSQAFPAPRPQDREDTIPQDPHCSDAAVFVCRSLRQCCWRACKSKGRKPASRSPTVRGTNSMHSQIV